MGVGRLPRGNRRKCSRKRRLKPSNPHSPKDVYHHMKNPLVVEMTELRLGELVSAHTESDCRRDSNPGPLTPALKPQVTWEGPSLLRREFTLPPQPTGRMRTPVTQTECRQPGTDTGG